MGSRRDEEAGRGEVGRRRRREGCYLGGVRGVARGFDGSVGGVRQQLGEVSRSGACALVPVFEQEVARAGLADGLGERDVVDPVGHSAHFVGEQDGAAVDESEGWKGSGGGKGNGGNRGRGQRLFVVVALCRYERQPHVC